MASRWTYKVTRDESRRDGKKQRTNKHRSPLAYVEEAPCVAELRYLAVRRTFGWRGAAAAYAKSAGGFVNSAAKSAEKLGLASGKAGKQLGYALHRTLSAEWLLRERDVVGLPQGLPELLDGAIRELVLARARELLVGVERLDQVDQELLGHAPVGQPRRQLVLVLLERGVVHQVVRALRAALRGVVATVASNGGGG